MLAGTSACSEVERRSRDAWHGVTAQPQHPAHGVDINSATRDEIASLPGLNAKDAARIIAHRPYADRDALLQKHVLGKKKYQRIQGYVYVGRT